MADGIVVKESEPFVGFWGIRFQSQGQERLFISLLPFAKKSARDSLEALEAEYGSTAVFMNAEGKEDFSDLRRVIDALKARRNKKIAARQEEEDPTAEQLGYLQAFVVHFRGSGKSDLVAFANDKCAPLIIDDDASARLVSKRLTQCVTLNGGPLRRDRSEQALAEAGIEMTDEEGGEIEV